MAQPYIVTSAAEAAGVRVYAEGCCPDPGAPGGYAVCVESDTVSASYGTLQYGDGLGRFFAYYGPSDPLYAQSVLAISIDSNVVVHLGGSSWLRNTTWSTSTGTHQISEPVNNIQNPGLGEYRIVNANGVTIDFSGYTP